MFTTGLSSDPNSLSGNLLDAMAKHTRAAINDTLRVVMDRYNNHFDYRPTGNWSVAKDVAGNSDITAAIDQLISSASRSSENNDGSERRLNQARDDLTAAIADHIRWEAESVGTKVVHVLTEQCEDLALANFDQIISSQHKDSKEQFETIFKEVEATLKAQNAAVDMMERRVVSAELPKSVARAQEDYAINEAWAREMANKLYAIDMAQQESDKEHEAKRIGMNLEQNVYFRHQMYKDHLDLNKLLATDRANHLGRVQSHYEGCSNDIIARIGTKPEKLVIVNNLMKDSKGVEQANKMEEFVMSKAVEYWAIIPDIFRIYKDIDVNTGLHWSPPKLDDDKFTEAHQYYRQQQSKKLATAIMSVAPNTLKATLSVASTFGEGKNKANFKAELDDGLSLYWHMIQRYHPIDRNTGHHLLQDICKLCSTVSSGNVIQNLRAIQTKVHEAQNICVKIPWSLTGIPMIDNLSKVPAMAVELIPLKESCVNFADSGAELDLALAAALRAQDMANSASSSEKKALQASNTKQSKPAAKKALKAAKAKELQALADELGFKVDAKKRNHDSAFAAKADATGGKDQGDGICHVIGCSKKIENFKACPYHKICSTCLLECRTKGKDLPLKKGGTWHAKSKPIVKQVKAIMGHKAFSSKLKKQLKEEPAEDEEDDQATPSDEEEEAPAQQKAQSAKRKKRDELNTDPHSSAIKQVENMRRHFNKKKVEFSQ